MYKLCLYIVRNAFKIIGKVEDEIEMELMKLQK
jgi:hypothetical protein